MSAVPYLSVAVPLRLASAGTAAAFPVLAVQEVHSLPLGGGLVAASLAPSILAAPLVGALLDRSRHPVRLVLLSGAVTAVALGTTALLGLIPTVLIVVSLVVAGATTPFFMGGLSSFVADAIPGTPERAFGLDALAYNVGSVGGPAVAAGFIALGSARTATVGLAVVAAVGTLACGFLRLSPHPELPERAGVLREIVRGSRYLTTHRPIAAVTLSGALSQLGQGALPIAAVGIALTTTRDAGDAAWVVTGFAVGALVGTLAVTAFPIRHVPAIVVMASAWAATGVLTLAAALQLGLPVVIVLVGLSGVASGPGVTAMLLLRTRHSPRALRSLVLTVAAGVRATGAALGAGLGGLLPSSQATLLLSLIGACWLVSAGVLAGYPRHATAAEPVGPAV
jgi:MFS family permease